MIWWCHRISVWPLVSPPKKVYITTSAPNSVGRTKHRKFCQIGSSMFQKCGGLEVPVGSQLAKEFGTSDPPQRWWPLNVPQWVYGVEKAPRHTTTITSWKLLNQLSLESPELSRFWAHCSGALRSTEKRCGNSWREPPCWSWSAISLHWSMIKPIGTTWNYHIGGLTAAEYP